jgi:hypothetical protein
MSTFITQGCGFPIPWALSDRRELPLFAIMLGSLFLRRLLEQSHVF